MKRERRKFTHEFKANVALEAIKEKLTVAEISDKFKITTIQVKAWKQEFLDNVSKVFGGDKNQDQKEKEQRTKQEQELFEQIGRLKMENEWLKKKCFN